MRVAHITDLHVLRPPPLASLAGKRALGAVNLYLLGRAHHFTLPSVEALVHAVVELAPDVVVCSGDLTATALPAEFALARELLAPLLDRFPFVSIPGNHDVYTADSVGRYAEAFAAPAPWDAGPFRIVPIDVCHPDWLSRGRAGPDALAALDAELAGDPRPAWVLVHYPLRDRHGAPYGPPTRALADAAELEARIGRHGNVRAVLHGHEHHGYRTTLGGVPVLDPGAGGYACLPARRRTAHFNVYTTRDGTIDVVERYAYDGHHFVQEAGGAYATGG